MARGWGKILVGTRLEKQVSSRFFQVWTQLITRGIAPGDGVLSVRGKVAHKAANELVRMFLRTGCDSLLFVDSDAVVEPDIVDQFRRYEPGFEYDALQAFYCRRGWPPSAIWMRENALGQMTDIFVTRDDWIEDVDVVGLHCTIVRREVFESMLGDGDAAAFEWFYYPRHREDSEDGAFSGEARGLAFRLGATTAIKAGHISELTTTWDTYRDWLQMTGRDRLVERYRALAGLVAEFVGEDADLVVAKSLNGRELVRQAWERYAPRTPDEVREFYGAADNGYLYDLLQWNCQPMYERLIGPLYEVTWSRALVVGAGLGTEVEALLENKNNRVDVYELPGVLRRFVDWRFGRRVDLLADWPSMGQYDVVVAIDVLEHVHPNEIERLLRGIDGVLSPGGALVLHTTWGGADMPQHYDNRDVVSRWLDEGYEKEGESLWLRSS